MNEVESYPVTYLFESRTYRIIDAVYYTTPLQRELTNLQNESISIYGTSFRQYNLKQNTPPQNPPLTSSDSD